MSGLPADWPGLLAVVYLLGMRHGLDADHLATIDGLTRANQHRPRLARSCGLLFSFGHGLVVIAVSVMIGLAAGQWTAPQWLDTTGLWISVIFLAVLGAFNIANVLKTAPTAVVRPAGLLGRWLGAAGRATHPVLIAASGALFALSFDTLSQVALFAFAAKALSGVSFCAAIGLVFMLGMMTSDGINGFWISRLLQRADRRARIGSRAMGLTIGVTSLLVALYVVARETLEPVAEFADGRDLEGGLLVLAIVLASFLAAMRLAAADPVPAID